MAGFSIQVLKADAGNSNAMIVSSGLTVTLRVSPYSGTTYTLSEVGTTGVYNIATVNDGVYKLYIGGVEQTQYGTFWIGDSAPQFDTIAERTAGSGVTIDGILLKDSLNGSSIMALTGNQTAAGVKTFSSIPKASAAATQATELIRWDEAMRLADTQTVTGIKTFSGAINASNAQVYFTHATIAPRVSSQPDNDASVCRKDWIQDQINSASGNYVESVNEVAVFPELSANITGVAYADIVSAINSFSSPAVTNQCCVIVKGTGASSQYIQCNVTGLKDYVHIKGLGKHINIVLGVGVETATNQNMRFENCSIFLGINTITGARTFSNVQWVNCDIYVYNDITFDGDNAKMHNCRVYSASGHDITYDDAIQITGSYFMQNTTAGDDFDGVFVGNYDNCKNSYTPPTDPSPTP